MAAQPPGILWGGYEKDVVYVFVSSTTHVTTSDVLHWPTFVSGAMIIIPDAAVVFTGNFPQELHACACGVGCTSFSLSFML